MIYGSVCAGIEAATVAWGPLGWEAAWFSEIESFPCAVLQHHYPEVPNLGDMTKLHEKEIFNDTDINVLIGGTPCQSFSIAGLRKGMADPRGNLALVFLSLIDRARPSWVVWENVPGVLSSSGGRDFGAFLGGLAEFGYGFAYRILDAQFFGVPQRRRRVFVVGYSGDWRPAAAVLFERHSLSGNTAPSRKTGERTSPTVTGGPPFSRTGNERIECEAIVFQQNTRDEVRYVGGDGQIAGALSAEAGMKQQNYIMAHGQRNAEIRRDGAPSLTCNHEAPIVVMSFEPGIMSREGGHHYEDISGTLRSNAGDNQMAVAIHEEYPSTNSHGIAENVVRRLTPRECERLQGFPDDYTLVSYRNKPAADGPRYKALGNSMAVPVIRWLGARIEAVMQCL